MAVLSEADFRTRAQRAGFSGGALDMITAIGHRESGFNPDAYNGNEGTGDNSVGLVQINMIGSLGASRLAEINRLYGAGLRNVDEAKAWLKNPDNNLKYAYYLSNEGTNFQPWSTAGAAAQDVAGGTVAGGGSSNMAGDYSDFITSYGTIRKQWKPLNDKIAPYVDGTVKGNLIHVPGDGIYASVPAVNEDGTEKVDDYGNPVNEQILVMTEQEYSQWEDLGGQLADLEHQYEAGGGNLDDAIKRIDFQYETDPRNIDAANTADKFAREMDVRTTATSQANQALAQQSSDQKDAVDSYNSFLGSSTPGSVTMVPRTKLPTQDDLFQQAIDRVSKGLPEVTDRPYYGDTTLPAQGAGEGGAAGLRLGADAFERSQAPKPKGLFGTVSGGITSTINNVKSAISTALPGSTPAAASPTALPRTAGPAAQGAPIGTQSPAQQTAGIAGSIFSYFR